MAMTAADSEGLNVTPSNVSPSHPASTSAGGASAAPSRQLPPSHLPHIITPPAPLPPPAPHTPVQQAPPPSMHGGSMFHSVALPSPSLHPPLVLHSLAVSQPQVLPHASPSSLATVATSPPGGPAGVGSASAAAPATPKRIVSSSNGKSCCIDGCTSKQYDRDGNYVGLSFFSMTEKSGRESLWKEFIHRKNCKKHFICELHFKSDDIQMTLAGRKKVKNGARPTRNLNGNFTQSGGIPPKTPPPGSASGSATSSTHHGIMDPRGGSGVPAAWRTSAAKLKLQSQAPPQPKEYLISTPALQAAWKKSDKSYGSGSNLYHPYHSLQAESKRFKSDSGVDALLPAPNDHVTAPRASFQLQTSQPSAPYRNLAGATISVPLTRPQTYLVQSDASDLASNLNLVKHAHNENALKSQHLIEAPHHVTAGLRPADQLLAKTAPPSAFKLSNDDQGAVGRTLIMQSLSAPGGHHELLTGAALQDRRHTEPPIRSMPLHVTPPHLRVEGTLMTDRRDHGGDEKMETLVLVEDATGTLLAVDPSRVSVTEDVGGKRRLAASIYVPDRGLPPSPASVFGSDPQPYIKWASAPGLGQQSPPAVVRGMHSPPSSPHADQSSPVFESPLGSPTDNAHHGLQHSSGHIITAGGSIFSVPSKLSVTRNLTSHFPYLLPPHCGPGPPQPPRDVASSPLERLDPGGCATVPAVSPLTSHAHAPTTVCGVAAPLLPPQLPAPSVAAAIKKMENRNPLMVLAEAAALLSGVDDD